MYFLYVLCESEREREREREKERQRDKERERERERERSYDVGVSCLFAVCSFFVFLFAESSFALNFVFQSFANLCHDFFGLLLVDVRVLKLYIFIIYVLV
jgi:hypothetical protein